MNATTDLVVPKDVLSSAHLSADEFKIEIATHLYATKRLTMGQAKRFAGLDQIAFQHELAKRDIHIHLTWDDVEKDLENLRELK
jgi:predicted HTH domain antitoxin